MPFELNEEEKKKALAAAAHFWYVFVIVGLVLIGLFQWQSGVKIKKELAVLQSINSTKATIEELDGMLAEMEKRKALLYPEIAKKAKELAERQSKLENQRKGFKNVKKSDIAARVEKMDINELNAELKRMGYDLELK